MKILVVEDEPDMLKIIRLYLVNAGYTVAAASDGRKALEALEKSSYNLVISDWMMPGLNGLELCKEIRRYGIPVKIIMLTARGDVSDEITGLSGGADDYIKKPFHPQLLLLHIRKMFPQEQTLSCGEITLNTESHAAFVRGTEIRLTQKEWLLLQYFLTNKGMTLTRDRLLEAVWGADYDGDERTLDTHVKRLRGKIGEGYIHTYVGLGYRMEEPHE